VASGTFINGVIMPSNPYSQFLQPNMKYVHFIPKIRNVTKTIDRSTPSQNSGWIQANPLIPRPNTRFGTSKAAARSDRGGREKKSLQNPSHHPPPLLSTARAATDGRQSRRRPGAGSRTRDPHRRLYIRGSSVRAKQQNERPPKL